MDRRARTVIPRLFRGETIEEGVSDPPNRVAARLLEWLNSADDRKFVETLRALSGEGGRYVPGRTRGGGKRSRARFEPQIMGEVRGVGGRDHKGGAPTNDAEHELVMHLVLDWSQATGETPKPGRSDHTGFGDLVHSVFQWLDSSGDSSATAAYALRGYWSAVRKRKDRAASLVEVPVCADCRWVQLGTSRDDFWCQKLSLACTTAREADQGCGPKGVLFGK